MDKVILQLLFVFSCLSVLIRQAELRTAKYELDERKIKLFHEQWMKNRERARGMAISKPKPGVEDPQSKVPCISGGTLTEWTLKHLINSVLPGTFKNTADNMFYALTDYGLSVTENPDPLYLLWSDALDLSNSHPSKLWFNHPPPVNSSRYLMQVYQHTTPKPTIEILGMFSGVDLDSFIDQLKCLAKMKKLGFSFVHWDVQDFRNHMHETHCQSLLDEASSTTGFSDEVNLVESLLEHVNEISANLNIDDWCPIPQTMTAKIQDMRALQKRN